ncbi:response regulator [Vampirovibrio chlorellavorus]|uniref:response regulator n=1 Tax=Vampirovibrio chlorellavorus TaxID=758823 RepID=UPI0026E9CE45|nr:response regulator transcription factor [Vampirovibrio chlorellavorus]
MIQTSTKVESSVIRLVLVEDYKLVRIGLRSVLNEDPRIEVVGEAETGEQGIEMIKSLKPDLVVLDLGLPGMDGIEVTKAIKNFDENIKVVILTSHEVEDEVLAALSAGANAYCLKEITSNRLIEVVKSVFEGAAWLDPAIAGMALEMFSSSSIRPKGNGQAARADLQLTERENQVLTLLVEGKSNSEIADCLSVSVHTAKAHVCSILQKLSVHDRVQAAVKAVKENLV